MIIQAGTVIYSNDNSAQTIYEAKEHAKRFGLTPKEARLVRCADSINLELIVSWDLRPQSSRNA